MIEVARRAQCQLARESLRRFIFSGWRYMDPAEYVHNWHIDALSEHLEAVSRGEIKRLLINMPPRHMKSLMVSVAWPAWDWISNPKRGFLFTSYALDLAVRDTTKSRRVINSDWYQGCFGDSFTMTSDQNAKTRYDNDKGGYRLVGSVDSKITGEGGDIIVVDDPHNVQESGSQIKMANVVDWWDEAMSTRLNNPKTGAYVVVMQRVAENDLSGHILAKNQDWYHLVLPAEYEPGRKSKTLPTFTDPRTKPGELLWPERFGEQELAELRTGMTASVAEGQLNQNPQPKGGSTFSIKRIGEYDSLPRFNSIIGAFDGAFKKGEHNDYTVMTAAGISGGLIYVLGSKWLKIESPDLLKNFEEFYNTWRGETCRAFLGATLSKVYVEDAQSGTTLLQEAKRLSQIPTIAVTRTRDKISRYNDVSPTIEAGKVLFPTAEFARRSQYCTWKGAVAATWMEDSINQLKMINPLGRYAHDDFADTLADIIENSMLKSTTLQW